MQGSAPSVAGAQAAIERVEGLQARLVEAMRGLAAQREAAPRFERSEWLRDDGRHGGGFRYGCGDTLTFNRASANVSAVHYDDDPSRPLAAAIALSAIVHPRHPLAPSMHLHLSWTARRDGHAGWRVMADLNPSLPDSAATERFRAALAAAAPARAADAFAQGDRYFAIPSLGRHRGVCHFYLEDLHGDPVADAALGEAVIAAAIDTWAAIAADALADAPEPTEAQRAAQLAYHSLYFLQVLTLDRGTTAGLLVHDQNDVGVLGSLPARVDPDLLRSWVPTQPAPQDALLTALVDALPAGRPAEVDEAAKRRLAGVLRAHYRAWPAALDLQARGDVLPPTVVNHGRAGAAD